MTRTELKAPNGHHVVIDEPRPGGIGHYWWSCSCGDAGGPCANYNEAWDSVVKHEREGTER